MNGLSLRARLLAGMVFVVGALVAVALAVTALTRSHLTDQVDSQLAAAAETRRESPGRWPAGADTGRLSNFYEARVTPNYLVEHDVGPSFHDREKPAISGDDILESLDAGEPVTVGSRAGAGGRWRMQTVQSSGSLSVIALPLDDVDDTVRRLIAVEVVATVAVTAVLGAVAWWVLRLGIRPIKEMTVTAATIAGGNLTHRVPEQPPSSEAGELGRALNEMLASLEASFNERAAAQQRLQQFVADASHELRTPLTTIRGYTELYRLGGLADGAQLEEAMRRTEQETVRMARLVDDMLTLAKLGAGRPLEQRPVDVRRLLDDAAADARAVAPDREITVAGPADVTVVGDEDRLRQVLANVVGNALVHTPDGTAVELAARETGEHVVVEVTDHGRGMAPEVAAKVTERFYRADRGRSRISGGSGLGMAIVDATVAAHGGSVVIDSDVGRGTTVRLTLPRPLPAPVTP